VDLEDRIQHPLRAIRVIVNEVLAALSGNFQRSIRRRGGRYHATKRGWHYGIWLRSTAVPRR
jgi:hypothetical protein